MCVIGLLSSINKPWIDFFFLQVERRSGRLEGPVSASWRQRISVWDPAASSLSPPPLLPVRRDTTYQGGIRRTSRLLIFSASTTVPFTLPVWWILFSALLSWVIWGIIPKVSIEAEAVGGVSSGTLCFRRSVTVGYVIYSQQRTAHWRIWSNNACCVISVVARPISVVEKSVSCFTKRLHLLHNIKSCDREKLAAELTRTNCSNWTLIH